MTVAERFGPTRRGGPVFRWLGEPLAIDLANTVMVVREPESPEGGAGNVVDLLATPSDLRRWLAAEGGRLAGYEIDAERDLGAVRDLRDAVRALLLAAAEAKAPPAEAVGLVNEVSAASPVAPQLATSGARLSAQTSGRDRSLAGLLGAVARSAVELLSGPAAGTIRVCRAPSCGMFYLGGRRWCCSACGNRARAARHYRRHRSAPGRATAGPAQ